MLHWASKRGYLEVVKFLLTNRARLEAVDTFGYTALDYCCVNNDSAIFEFLLLRGSQPFIKSPNEPRKKKKIYMEILEILREARFVRYFSFNF